MTYRPSSILRISFVLATLGGCVAPGSDEAQSDQAPALTASTNELTPLRVGLTLRTTTDVSLLNGPSSSVAALGVVPAGQVVTIVSEAPSGAFYQVSYNAMRGWAAAADLGPTQAFPIVGDIHDAFVRLGGDARFGLPLEAERPGPGGTVQHFQRGCIGPDGSGELSAFSICEDPPDMTPVLTQIWQTIKSHSNNTSTAMGVEWLPSNQRATLFGDEMHVSASSPKWSWAMAAVAKQGVGPVEAAAVETFKTSNNTTAGQLIDLAGGIDAVNAFTINALGIPQTSFNLCYWGPRHASSCSSGMGADNFFTPNGVLTFLEGAWARRGINRADGDTVLGWALLSPRNGYGGWLGTQLPQTAQAAMYHKAGWLPPGTTSSDAKYNNMNEIGIVVTPRGPYAVSILLDHGTDYWGAQTTSMEWASCVIYHAFAQDAADPFAAGCTAP